MQLEKHHETHAEAFHLKFDGDYEQALKAYAREYSYAQRQDDPFIMGITFEQMFDSCLLLHLQKRSRFDDKKALLNALQRDIMAALIGADVSSQDDFKEELTRCQRLLFPRGRGKNPFSLDPKLLVRSRE